MKNYIGFLIRQTRLEQNISQEGLCKGICVPSYLSKIEQGHAEPSDEIIDQLFSALGILYQRNVELMAESEEHLKKFFYLWEAEEPFEKELEYIQQHADDLEHSELHLDYHLVLMLSYLSENKDTSAEAERSYLSRFLPYMEDMQLVQYYLGAAEIIGCSEEAVQLLTKAAHYGDNSIIYYHMARVLYHLGHYSACIQRAKAAYRYAAEEGNPAVLIGASFLLGSCHCNGRSLAIAEKFYGRAISLTRGYREQVENYAYYNLGTAYLSNRQYQKAKYYLLHSGELNEKPYHNIMLNQKRALLFIQIGSTEKAKKYVTAANLLLQSLPDDNEDAVLCRKMLSFAEMLLEPDYMKLPAYGALLETLYGEAGDFFGFGFRRFYGLFLIDWYKHQRRYKDALRILEEIEIS